MIRPVMGFAKADTLGGHVITGGVEIVKIPVVAAKTVLFVLVAAEVVDPYVPLAWLVLPRIRELALWFKPVPKLAITPVFKVILLLIVIAFANVFVPLPDKVRL